MKRSVATLGMLLILIIYVEAPAEQVSTDCFSSRKGFPLSEDAFHIVSRADYVDRLEGFWLGACLANWTGLVTEMDKIGDTAQYKTGRFYTREDWGSPDLPNIWSDQPSELSPTIDFVVRGEHEVWGADYDTDIEYMYQFLLLANETNILSAEQIREGWLKRTMASGGFRTSRTRHKFVLGD